MRRLRTSIIIAGITFGLGLIAVAGWLWIRETPPEIVSVTRADSLVFSDDDLDGIVTLAHIPKLRDVSTRSDDLEIRIWRGRFTDSTEGVFIRRFKGGWTAEHLTVRSNNNGSNLTADLNDLGTPRSGWNDFEEDVIKGGLMKLPLSPEVQCSTGYDPIVYVVEVNVGNKYRNYRYPMGDLNCRETREMGK